MGSPVKSLLSTRLGNRNPNSRGSWIAYFREQWGKTSPECHMLHIMASLHMSVIQISMFCTYLREFALQSVLIVPFSLSLHKYYVSEKWSCEAEQSSQIEYEKIKGGMQCNPSMSWKPKSLINYYFSNPAIQPQKGRERSENSRKLKCLLKCS